MPGKGRSLLKEAEGLAGADPAATSDGGPGGPVSKCQRVAGDTPLSVHHKKKRPRDSTSTTFKRLRAH